MGNNSYDDNYNYRGGSNNYGDNDEVVSTAGWVGILILTSIPFVNIIAMLIMAFSQGNKNIKNYAKASLILIAIPLTLVILLKGCSTY
jgi:hypothetical protein